MSFTLDEPGTLNWVVVKQGDNFGVNTENPTRLDQIRIEGVLVGGRVIRKGGPVRAARGGTAYSFTISGLEPQTAYDLFYTAKDTAGNYCVYNKTIAFPYPIKTLDNEGPTASLDYSDKATDANGVDRPWADSDIYIEFSEVVQGIGERNLDQPDDFYALYQRVQNSSGTEQAAAKRDLAAVLQKYISFYKGTPPSGANSKPRKENEVTVKDGSQSAQQLEALPDWIDFREAVVSREGSKTTITFPGNGVGVKLQSGQRYYFMLQNIEDTSNNPMASPTYLPFTTAFATVKLEENQEEESVTINGQSRPAKIFSLSPEGTEAVSKDTRWDMIIWAYADIDYELLVRPLGSGASGWKSLGTINAHLPNANTQKVYNSLNGNFNTELNQALIDTGLFGSIQAGNGRPYLNEFTSDLEFAIVPAAGTVENSVKMEVQVFAGTNTQIGAIARSQGTAVSGQATPIGDPDPFPLTVDPPDEAPRITVGYQGITTRANYANITLGLSRSGTVWAAAIPLDNPVGASYTMHEAEPRRLAEEGGGKPNLNDVGDSLTSPVPHMLLDSKAPVPLDVVRQRNFVSNTTKFANTGSAMTGDNLRTTFRIEGLTPETTYLIYLVATNTDGTPSKNAVCFKLTTTPPDPPKMEIAGTGNTVNIRVKPSSQLRYVLVNHREISGTIFGAPFQTGAAYVDTSKGPLPADYRGTTVYEAMMYPMPNTDPDDVGTNYRNSLFDIYATQTAKRLCWEALGDPASGANFPAESVVLATLRQHENKVMNETGNINMEPYMKNQIPYLLIAGAKPSDSDNYAFQVTGDYITSVTANLRVTSCLFTPTNPQNPFGPGQLTVIFNQAPTFSPKGALDDPPRIDTCADGSNGHNGETPVNGFVPLGYVCDAAVGVNLRSPAPNRHGSPISTALTYDVPLSPMNVQLIFKPGLANAGGVPVKGQDGSNAGLVIRFLNDGTADQPNWQPHWSRAFGGDIPD